MTGPTAQRRRRAAGLLLCARAVYAFNWYNVGAVLPLVQTSLHMTTAELGVVLAAFLVGAGVFQLPAGFAAMRWGGRRLSIAALVVMGLAGVASGFAPDWEVLALLRFAVGAGAALFFAPALQLVASYYPEGSRGPVIGLYNSGFGIGSGLSLVVGALLGERFGWPSALLVGGVALLAAAALLLLLLPVEPPIPPRPFGSVWRDAQPIVRSRSLWTLSVGVGGLWGAYYIAAQFFPQYARASGATGSLVWAALVPAVLIAFDIVGGPVGGWFAERSADVRRLLLGWGIASGVLLAVVPFLGFATLWPLFATVGFAEGVVFAGLYLYPSYLAEIRVEGFALALAQMNALQLFMGSALAYGFGLVAEGSGYAAAWAYTGVAAVVPLTLLAWTRRVPETTRAGPAPAGS